MVIDADKNKSLHSKNEDQVREMASLTKIMTALVSIMLVKELDLNMSNTYFTVGRSSAGCCGTTAFLVADQKVKIIDLLYALMLPSGNDAALTLAENFGRLMRTLKRIGPKKDRQRPPFFTWLLHPCGH